jgi:hypothetical protein
MQGILIENFFYYFIQPTYIKTGPGSEQACFSMLVHQQTFGAQKLLL